MSQSGKVLHLYVEVRAASEHDGKEVSSGESITAEEVATEMLTHLASVAGGNQVSSSAGAPKLPAKTAVSFQLQQSGDATAAGNPTPTHTPTRVPLPPLRPMHSEVEGEGTPSKQPQPQHFHIPPPSPSPGTRQQQQQEQPVCPDGAPPGGKRSVVTFSYIEKANIKKVEAAPSPLCPSGGGVAEVTEGSRSTPSHLRKRLSDPFWFGSPDSSCSNSPKLPFRGLGLGGSPGGRRSTLDSAIGRAATQRALEDFGSPLLRCRFAHELERGLGLCQGRGFGYGCGSPQHQHIRCQSWAGSPVPLRNSSAALPSPACAALSADPHKHSAQSGLPRSPASDQLSSQVGPAASNLTQTPSPRPRSYASPHAHPSVTHSRQASGDTCSPGTHGTPIRSTDQRASAGFANQLAEGMNQLSKSTASAALPASPANSPEVARKLAEEATRVSEIFNEVRSLMTTPPPQISHNALSGSPTETGCHRYADALHTCVSSPAQRQPIAMNIPVCGGGTESNLTNEHEHQQQTGASPPFPSLSSAHGPDRSPANHTSGQNGKNPPILSTVQYSVLPAGGPPVSPAIPSRLLRPAVPKGEAYSPIRDPRLLRRCELQPSSSPTLHRRQPPQYTGDSWFPLPDRCALLGRERTSDGGLMEAARRLFLSQGVEETPVSWTSREEEGEWGNLAARGRGGTTEDEDRSRRRRSRRRMKEEDEADDRREKGESSRCQTQNQDLDVDQLVLLSPAQERLLKRAEQRRREALLLGPVALELHRDTEEEEEDDEEDLERVSAGGHARVGGQGGVLLRVEGEAGDVGGGGAAADQNGGPPGSSRSSSGVTGSLGDRDCVSPESSHSSQQSNETGHATSGIQVCGCVCACVCVRGRGLFLNVLENVLDMYCMLCFHTSI